MNKRKLSFKWFGSLSNLSARRPSLKVGGTKAAPMLDDAPRVEDKPAAGGQSVDDMEPRPHSLGYAQSGQMYTHVGTVPRSQRQKTSCKGMKEKKKKKKEEGEGEGVRVGEGQVREDSQWTGDEHVQPSPLLAALSSLSVSSEGDRPLPAPPQPSWASPLTPTPDPPADTEASGEVWEQDARSPQTSSAQDLYVPMDPISGSSKLGSSRSTAGLQGALAPDSGKDVSDCSNHGGGGDYVKFCKDKFWLEPPSEKLRKQLEEELKLSGTNLKSHAWYHGHIPWEIAESLVVNSGDFLIRDSQSHQGDFVLTGQWEQKTLHFLIRRSVVQSSETYTRVQYSLADEAFDSVPALVHFYVGSKAALTQWSGAQIHRPINRTLPLSYLETAFGIAVSQLSRCGEETTCPRSPSCLHHKEADLLRKQEEQQSKPEEPPPSASAAHSNMDRTVAPPTSPCGRPVTPRPLPSPCATLSRQPADGPPGSRGSSRLLPGPHSFVERLQEDEAPAGEGPPELDDGGVYVSPLVETASCFRPARYQSGLMPRENKPLEVGILRRVKELLAELEPRTAAQHITKADCLVARILDVSPEVQRMMGVSSGVELLTLPHGQQLRLDLLERFHTMATTLAVELLGCTGSTEERAALLHKLIQIAAELKSTMGNMFGFAVVMRALELPQVSRLEQTWAALRQRHTEAAVLYEKTLRPFGKSLNEGRESCSLSHTTFPHVLPLLSLLERGVAAAEGAEPWDMADVGVDVVMFHLGAARTMAQLGGIYRSNAEAKLKGCQEQPEVLEIFHTDFQMRLLWGNRGAEESQVLRYAKFDQVLTALSNRLEPPARAR